MKITTLYWPNGRMKREVSFLDGVRSGWDRMWNEEGVLVDEEQYENGKPVSAHRGDHPEEDPMPPPIRPADPIPYAYEDNRALCMERFPKLGLLLGAETPEVYCFEGIDTREEIGKAECIYIYGIGGGAAYFQLQDWLHADPKRRLVFLGCRLASFVSSAASKAILQDPQVLFATEDDEPLPIQRIEMFALPSKKGRHFRSFKMRFLRKAALSSAFHIDRLQAHYPFHHFIKNMARVPSSFYANALQNAFSGMPAIVCGAGPSLESAIPLLKQLSSRALIIAGGSTLAALSSQGVPIHFGIAIDPNLEEYHRFKNSFAFDTPLLYSTRVHPLIFQTCSGPFGYMRSGIGGFPEFWMEKELGLTDPFIGIDLSREAASVTTICAAWAQFIGCSAIFFSGLDLAYTRQKRYASGVAQEDTTPLAALDLEKSAANRILKRKNRKGKYITTATRWVMEAAVLSHFAKKHKKIRFFNTTEEGLPIPGVPYLPLQEAAEKRLQNTWDIVSLVQAKIAQASMPANSAVLAAQKIDELKQSLQRMQEHLEVLAGKKKGSRPLAELELQDEMALPILFYDTQDVLEKDQMQGKPLSAQEMWARFLRCVEQHLTCLQ